MCHNKNQNSKLLIRHILIKIKLKKLNQIINQILTKIMNKIKWNNKMKMNLLKI